MNDSIRLFISLLFLLQLVPRSMTADETTPVLWIQEAQGLFEKGRFEECTKLIKNELQYADIDQDKLFDVLILQATALQRLGSFQNAYDSLRKITNEIKNLEPQRQVTTYIRISDLFLSIGRIEAAVDYAEKAHAIATDLDNPLIVANTLHNLGNVAMVNSESDLNTLESGQWNQEIPSLMSSNKLLIAKRGNPRAIGMRQTNETFKQIQMALQYYEDSRDSALKAGRVTLAARSSINMAQAAIRLKDYDLAVSSIQECGNLCQDVPENFDKGFLYLSLGILASQLDIPPSDNKHVDPLLLSWNALNIADQVGKTLGSGYLQSYAKGYLGRLYENEHKIGEAIQLTRSAIFFAQQETSPEILYRWQWQLGRLFAHSGRKKKAIKHYNQAIQTLDKVRHSLAVGYRRVPEIFSQRVKPVYYELAELYITEAEQSIQKPDQQNYFDLARDIIETMKTAELEDFFQDECVSVYKSKTVRLETIDADTVVIYPIALKNRIVLLVTLPDGIQSFTSPVDFKVFDQIVHSYRSHLQDETSIDYLSESKKLYDWLIRPLEPNLVIANIHTLIIVPDGVLTLIPFSTLYDGEKFLIEKYAIATTPGLNLIDPKPIARDNPRALVFGLSDAVDPYAALPGVQKEIQEIKRIIGGQIIQDKEFTKERVIKELKDASYQIMHVATHGKFDRNPEKTFLLTYKDKLTLDSLEQLIKFSQFRAEPLELLTLSACQTAVGDERAALGLAGVAVKSGAKSVMASLWYIDDKATTELISQFYRGYFTGNEMTKAKALQKAQKKLIASDSFNHPSHWAPFLLIGNWL